MQIGNHQSKEQDYLHVFALHLQKSSQVKLVRDPISVGIDPIREFTAVYFVVLEIR